MIPLFINCRDRCDTVIELVEWAENLPHVAIYLVDNASTYPPLLHYYRRTLATVLFACENGGPRTPWRFVRDRLDHQPFYVVTDCDLDLSEVPNDIVSVAAELLLQQTDLVKVGCALSLEGLPADHIASARESVYWADDLKRRPIINGRELLAYAAPIDTTFAVYRADGPQGSYDPALRLAGDYTCRHRPWFYTPNTLPDDERYYLDNLNPAGLFYSPKLKAETAPLPAAT